jgi:hypothetical protein
VAFIYNGIYSAIKKNAILWFPGKCMELENIILSEVSQEQKVKSCMFSPVWNTDPIQIQKYCEKQVMVTNRRGRVKEGS